MKQYYARVRIDPEAPLGVREIPNGPVLTEHSRMAANAEDATGRLIKSRERESKAQSCPMAGWLWPAAAFSQ